MAEGCLVQAFRLWTAQGRLPCESVWTNARLGACARGEPAWAPFHGLARTH